MRCLALIASLFSFVCAFAQTPADTSTPESALQAFFKAWNTKDTASAANLIAGVHIDAEQMKGVKEMMDPHRQLSGSEFQTIMQGDDAVVIYQLQIAQNGQSQTGEDMVQLKHTADGWRIVPPKSKGFNNIGRMGVSVIAQVIADPDFLKKARESAERATCASHIRQCGLGMIMYAADYDDVMKVPPSQSEVRKALEPYMRNKELFKCPDSDAYFSFNVNLAGKSFVDLKSPEQTILFYEGEKGKLNFRHDGKANVCFCDGHVKLVDAEQAKTLLWK